MRGCCRCSHTNTISSSMFASLWAADNLCTLTRAATATVMEPQWETAEWKPLRLLKTHPGSVGSSWLDVFNMINIVFISTGNTLSHWDNHHHCSPPASLTVTTRTLVFLWMCICTVTDAHSITITAGTQRNVLETWTWLLLHAHVHVRH